MRPGINIKNQIQQKRRNWNMFAGEDEYKTNFLLKFKSNFTSMRFNQDKNLRMRNFMKFTILLLSVIWTGLQFYLWDKWLINYLIVMLINAVAFYLTKMNKDFLNIRPLFFYMEIAWQIISYKYFIENGLFLHITLFNVLTYIISKFILL